jgi:hypothetical protein
MFALLRKTAAPGHNFGADEYNDHSVSVYSTLQEAVCEYLYWTGLPAGKFGHNDARIFEVDKSFNFHFNNLVNEEIKRQRAQLTETDKFLTAAGM